MPYLLPKRLSIFTRVTPLFRAACSAASSLALFLASYSSLAFSSSTAASLLRTAGCAPLPAKCGRGTPCPCCLTGGFVDACDDLLLRVPTGRLGCCTLEASLA
eukprot:6175173-Pleurochrysis_carterae.AAC.2